MSKIDVFRIEHKNQSIWLLSVGDKMLGEAEDLEQLVQEIQKQDLQLNWFILDVVDASREQLIDKLKLASNDTELQTKLETHVRELAAKGDFRQDIFNNFRGTIDDLMSQSTSLKRSKQKVFVGLKHRYCPEMHIHKIENQPDVGWIDEIEIYQGKVTLGMSNGEVSQMMGMYWFNETLLKKIEIFLEREYLGMEHSNFYATHIETEGKQI